MSVPLLDAERRYLLERFDAATEGTTAPAHAWSRRVYAPLHIHEAALAPLRARLARALPDHAPLFDILFEARAGAPVAFHCDYESLGPFLLPRPWEALRDAHFVSVHFNLTPGGGALRTLPWPRLSFLHHCVIVATGLYSAWHRALNALCAPLFAAFATRHPAAPGAGNVFNNMQLHAVGAGDAPRVSYVVRLVRRGNRVHFSRASLRAGAARSDATRRLHDALLPHAPDDGRGDDAAVDAAAVAGAPPPAGGGAPRLRR